MGEKGGWTCTVRVGEVPCDVMQILHAAADCYACSEHPLREGSRITLWGGISLEDLAAPEGLSVFARSQLPAVHVLCVCRSAPWGNVGTLL